jgi:hypothetical protein
MPSILKDGDHTIAIIKDESYANLLGEAGRLKEWLEVAVLLLDSISGVSVDTKEMKRVLTNAKVRENVYSSETY